MTGLTNYTDRESMRTARNTTRANFDTVVTIFKESYYKNDERPDQTAERIVDTLGYDTAVMTVAEIVNSVGEWDERVNRINRTWAANIDTAAGRDELRAADIYQPSEIHPCHIDSLASALRRYEPKPAEQETPENAPETAEEEAEEEPAEKDPAEIIETATKTVKEHKTRSAWDRGVQAYALELLEELAESIRAGYHDLSDLESAKLLEKALLNGAADWGNYSWGGCSLIYNCDIANRLCTPSELRKVTSGTGSEWYPKKPNAREEWLDTQARALYQASRLIADTVRALTA